jgi:opacity protein-like surface antigen
MKMFRVYCLTLTGVLAGTVAQAGNLEEVSVVPPVASIVTPAEVSGWTGFYAGLQFDEVSGNTERDSTPNSNFKADLEGSIVSGFVGHRWAVGRYIVGAELDIALNGDGMMMYTEGGLGPGENYDINSALRLGGEFGRELGGGLAYMGLGFAMLDVKLNNEFDDQGYYVGIGYDYFVADSIMVGVEINYHDFSELDGASDRVTPITYGVNAAFKF